MTSIVTNTAAQNATLNLQSTFDAIDKSVTRLTSGNRIVSASDDAAGLAIGTGLKTDVATLSTAIKNTSQAISLLNVADGGLGKIGEILQRQKELAVQANSGTLSATELGFLDTEFQGLKSQIDDIAAQTNFNGINLLDGNASGTSNAQTNTSATITYSDQGTVGTAALGGTDSFNVDNTNGNDLSLQGSISDVSVTLDYNANDDVNFQLVINGVVYTAEGVDVNATIAGTSDLTVTLIDAATTAEIELVLDSVTNAEINTGSTQTVADTVAGEIEADLASVFVYQARTFTDGTTTAVGFNTSTTVGTAVEGLGGDDFTLTSDAYSGTLAPTFSSFEVIAETASTDGKISVVVGNSTFSTAAGAFNTNGGDLQTLGTVTLTSADDSNELLTIAFGNLSASGTGITTTAGAQAFEDGLNAGFGVGSSGSLDFQVGLASTDLISITIADVQTNALYKDSSGVQQSLDLTTTTNANTASAVLDEAINAVLGARAGVGASQSRFGFAASNLDVTISNLDSARSEFLDTNIATESTAFASKQVLQQAGIAVLAQANLLPQSLLKLLG